METIEHQILNILSDHPNIQGKELSLHTNFREDLNVDSLIIAECAIEIEDFFNIRFTSTSFKEIHTISDVINAAKLSIKKE